MAGSVSSCMVCLLTWPAALQGRRAQTHSLRHFGSLADCGQDACVDTTAAHVALHPPENLLIRRVWIFCKQAGAGHNHPRNTVAALHGAGGNKGFLQRMQPAVLLESLNC